MPEIPRGRYLLADLGWISATREAAIAAGVVGLDRPRGDARDTVALPAVVMKVADGMMRMFRLPTSYAAAVKRFARLDDDIWEDRRPDEPPPRLPCHFLIGDEEIAYLVAEGQTKHLN